MIKKLISLVFILTVSINLFAANKIIIEGSNTILPIAQATSEAFMDKNSNVDITVGGKGSGVGINSLIEKQCTLATSSRPFKDEEIAKAKSKGVNPIAHEIAMDGIAIIVNQSNLLNNLSMDELRKIYNGTISDWSQVKGYTGKPMKIVTISRDSSSGTYETFEHLVLKGDKIRSDALINSSTQGIATTVKNSPGAIGYIGLGYVNETVKLLTVEKIACNEKNIMQKKYPISRPLFMYTNGAPTGETKNFINFVLSKEGQEIVKDSGYIKIK